MLYQSRYIKGLRGKSGQGIDENSTIKQEFEHLWWLITIIKYQETQTNLKIDAAKPCSSSIVTEADENKEERCFESQEVEVVQEVDVTKDDNGDLELSILDSQSVGSTENSPCQPPSEKQKCSDGTTKQPWAKVRKKKNLDEKLSDNIEELNKAIKEADCDNTRQTKDEKTYCLSLVSRLKAFEGRLKSLVRFQIEKVFHNAELSTFQLPHQGYHDGAQFHTSSMYRPDVDSRVASPRPDSPVALSNTAEIADVYNGHSKTLYTL